ncbi:MAG TPA: hypothetical protein PKC23_06615 [Candidatus Desulfobacillus sp.]|nr:hypothetical protein [Candidatus Desulfobacillus sp.]
MKDAFFDGAGWQAMLSREEFPASPAAIGLLRRQEHASRRGTLLLWRSDGGSLRADFREYNGTLDADIAVLLVADEDALGLVRDGGLAALPGLIRRGRLSPYILKTLRELEAAELADFIEDLELTEPKH